MMPTHDDQQGVLRHMREHGVIGTFHYVPLDSSPAGRRFGRTPYPCSVTHDLAVRIVRLPLFAGMRPHDVDRVIDTVTTYRRP
jgi:dTDP-4-amino-4,6-dideoxygalactose transaminase